MLTSPMSVSVTTPNGASLKPHTSSPDASAGKTVLPTQIAQQPAVEVPPAAIELPSNMLLTHVNAVTATAANRTVLQDLTLNLATLLTLKRGDNENLTALFIRIIAAIDKMPQAERLQFEMRSGLKALKITLPELAAALRNPNGADAARLTAMAEAPLAAPGRTAANAATTTYLQQGTARGQAGATLAMSAAARSNAAGNGLFSAEPKSRPINNRPADARALQSQLKTLFEPNAAERRPVTLTQETLPTAKAAVASAVATAALPANVEQPESEAKPATASNPATQVSTRGETGNTKSEHLAVEAPAVDTLDQSVQPTVDEPAGTLVIKAETKPTPKAETSDNRLQTLLSLKGFAEAITALPGRAVELFTTLPETAPAIEQAVLPNPAALKTPLPPFATADAMVETERSEMADAEVINSATAHHASPTAVAKDEELVADATGRKAQAGNMAETARAAEANAAVLRPAVPHEGVPFAYAVIQPAREKLDLKVEEEDARRGEEEDDRNEDGSDNEKRRPRDEYDEMKDSELEDVPTIVITRDSSESDRAFALYQRMAGF